MRSKTTLIGCLLLMLSLFPILVNAQTTTHTTEHTYAFGQSAEFLLYLAEEVQAEDLRFFLEIEEEQEIHARSLDDGKAEYRRDLRARPFPAFAKITYWWEYQDSDGTLQATKHTTFRYVDNRFDWQPYQYENVHLYWVTGSESLREQAIDVAERFQEEAQILFEEPLPEDVYVYVYPSQADLNQALRLSGLTWIGGEADPRTNVILLGLVPNAEAPLTLKQLLPHELTHLALAQNLGTRNYAELPPWVREGLASYFEQRPDPAYELALADAERKGEQLALETLCQPFVGLSQEQRLLAYAESQSLMRYIQQTYGWTTVRKLLQSYADGLGCSRGVERSLNRPLSALEREWRIWRAQDEQPAPPSKQVQVLGMILLRDVAPWLLLTVFLLLPSALTLITRRTA